MSPGRFVSLTEDELREITDGKDAKSTKNSTKYVANTVRNYLRNKNLPEDFENWSKADLDSRLRCFYAEVRSASGELHKRISLFSIRNGINRHLSKTSSINITKDAEFDASNDMFLSMCKYTVREGKGSVVHKDGIEHSDIEKTIYVYGIQCAYTNWFVKQSMVRVMFTFLSMRKGKSERIDTTNVRH
jgi:hypothetical protein